VPQVPQLANAFTPISQKAVDPGQDDRPDHPIPPLPFDFRGLFVAEHLPPTGAPSSLRSPVARSPARLM
jgi:hypothetical protein